MHARATAVEALEHAQAGSGLQEQAEHEAPGMTPPTSQATRAARLKL
jgi:hypothetical protein